MVGVENGAFRYIESPDTKTMSHELEMTPSLPATNGNVTNDYTSSLCVFGTGDFGRAFASRAVQSGFTVYLATRDVNKQKSMQRLIEETGAVLCSQHEALKHCNVVIMAVSHLFYDSLPLHLLVDKIVIDVSNVSQQIKTNSMLSNAERLQNLVPSAHVVKAFNVVSAYLLQTGGIQGSKEVPVASDDKTAADTVTQLVRDLGFVPVSMGPLRAARDMEKIPLEFFKEWRAAFVVVFVLFSIGYLMNFIKFQLCANLTVNNTWDWSVFKQLLMTNFNRNLGVIALTVLGAVYLPGVIAGYIQLYRGTKYRRFPGWLDRWLRMRKQLGLLMLAMAATHGCISLGIFHPHHQYDWLFDEPTSIRTEVMTPNGTFEQQTLAVWYHRTNWRGEVFLTLGAVSLCMLTILGISSLPSVTATLSWREFTFIQSGLGWTALVAASIHDGVLGGEFMLYSYKCYMPTGIQYALYLPVLCVLGKLILLIPPIRRRLDKIRTGCVMTSTSSV